MLVDRYFARFETDPACVLPPRPAGDDGHSWNMFNVLLPLASLKIDRSGFRNAMEARGIGTGVSYEALHLCTLGRRFGGREGQHPNAERIARETVTLPLHTRLGEADIDRVCEAAGAIIAAAGK
jgi:dTDP-4-amino-4,6-dideoxygalactose transaminase